MTFFSSLALLLNEHGLRTTHISNGNPNCTFPVMKKGAKKPPYWLLYVRIIGLRRRGGRKVLLKFLPHKLVRPKGRPPPISESELIGSNMLKRVAKGSVVFSDGAKAYHNLIKKSFMGKIMSRQVSHKNMEFTKKVSTPAGHSKKGGTQCIDGTWKHLGRFVSHALHTKDGQRPCKRINPALESRVNKWMWRSNHRGDDGFRLVGKLFKL